MRLFAGLGNPGSAYSMNRHNVGFMAVDRLASQHDFSPWKKRGASVISTGLIKSEKVILAKPQSFMNRSGLPVSDLVKFYKIEPHNVFVFHDELDLPVGKLRVKISGGHGGHNGLRDIDQHIGTHYWRVRIGIGRPPHDLMCAKAWVLANFSSDEQTGWLSDLLDAIVNEAGRLCQHDDGGFMSRVAYLAPAPDQNK